MPDEKNEISREKLKEMLQEYSRELFVKLNYCLLMDSSNKEDGDGRILWVDSIKCTLK